MQFVALIGSRNGRLSILATVAVMNNDPAIIAVFLFVFIYAPLFLIDSNRIDFNLFISSACYYETLF